MMTFTRLMEQDSKFNKGFTIIELLIVMVVISTIVGIAIPQMQGMKDEANQIKAKAETRAIAAAVESYYINRNPSVYPLSTKMICNEVLNDAKPLIVSEILMDPFLNTAAEYNYILSANGQFYVVYSVGINLTADITGISNEGFLQGKNGDDIFWTNGKGF